MAPVFPHAVASIFELPLPPLPWPTLNNERVYGTFLLSQEVGLNISRVRNKLDACSERDANLVHGITSHLFTIEGLQGNLTCISEKAGSAEATIIEHVATISTRDGVASFKTLQTQLDSASGRAVLSHPVSHTCPSSTCWKRSKAHAQTITEHAATITEHAATIT